MHAYMARHGDSVLSVAEKFGISPELLARANRISIASALFEGQKLAIPILVLTHTLRDIETIGSFSKSVQVGLEFFKQAGGTFPENTVFCFLE